MSGEEMRAIRRLLGMTQVQFGSDLGIPNPQVQVAGMETGLRRITKRVSKAVFLLVDNKKKSEALDKAGIKEKE